MAKTIVTCVVSAYFFHPLRLNRIASLAKVFALTNEGLFTSLGRSAGQRLTPG